MFSKIVSVVRLGICHRCLRKTLVGKTTYFRVQLYPQTSSLMNTEVLISIAKPHINRESWAARHSRYTATIAVPGGNLTPAPQKVVRSSR